MSSTKAGVSITPERSRSIFNKIARKLTEQGFKGVIQPARLRTEAYSVNGQSEYSLALKDNAPKLSTNREIRLKEQDAFVITRVSIGVLLETIAGPLGGEVQHFHNPALPFADESGGFQNAHLGVLWNGNLYLKVGDTVYLENFPIEDCYQPGTQQVTASLKGERGKDTGWIDVTPQYGIKGFDDNDFKLKLPSITSTHKVQYTATSRVVIVVEFDGFKITGAGTGKLDLAFGNLN